LFSYKSSKYCCYVILLVSLYSNCDAGAWGQLKNVSELNLSYEYKVLFDYYFDDQQQQNYLSKASQFELFSMHYQYGINDKYTLVLEEKWFNYKSSSQVYSGHNSNYDLYNLREEMYLSHYQKFENNPYVSKIGLQYELFKKNSFVFSIKPSIESYNNDLNQAAELGLLFGYNFTVNHSQHFINCEYYVSRDYGKLSGLSDTTTNLELTYSMGLTRRQSLVFQIFDQRNVGIYRDDNITRAQLSWQYLSKQGIGFKFGYATNLTHRKNYIVESYIAGVIIKF
jgi:hypothetical protein